jgi:Na+-transporting NADH:ubiquinone oxidoreductase subunit NqrB
MRPRGVIRLTGSMTTEHQRPATEPRRRSSTWFWMLFLGGTVVLVFLAVLPVVATAIAVALWGMGGSGSNK